MEVVLRVAMANKFARAPFEEPYLTSDAIGEWIIVSRIKGDRDYITISDAGSLELNNIPVEAPSEISPVNTFIGHLIRRNDDGSEIFLLVRDFDSSVSIDGMFFPTDGFAIVNTTATKLSIKASGRLESGSTKFAWHFDAERVPWEHETIT